MNVLIALIFAFLPMLVHADDPYPIRVGSHWVLEQPGRQLDTEVQKFVSIKSDDGEIKAARMVRNGNKTLYLFRTDDQWIECDAPMGMANLNACDHPVVILSWPLTVGKQWSSGGYDFLVVSKESVITPYQEYKDSYKV